MSIDFRNNISGQFYNMGLEQINDQINTSDSFKLAEKVALFMATLFPWVVEAALRYTSASLIKYSGKYLVALPISIIAGCSGSTQFDGILKYIADDFPRFTAIVSGALLSYEISNRTIPNKDPKDEIISACKRITHFDVPLADSYLSYPWVSFFFGCSILYYLQNDEISARYPTLLKALEGLYSIGGRKVSYMIRAGCSQILSQLHPDIITQDDLKTHRGFSNLTDHQCKEEAHIVRALNSMEYLTFRIAREKLRRDPSNPRAKKQRSQSLSRLIFAAVKKESLKREAIVGVEQVVEHALNEASQLVQVN